MPVSCSVPAPLTIVASQFADIRFFLEALAHLPVVVCNYTEDILQNTTSSLLHVTVVLVVREPKIGVFVSGPMLLLMHGRFHVALSLGCACHANSDLSSVLTLRSKTIAAPAFTLEVCSIAQTCLLSDSSDILGAPGAPSATCR